LQSLMKFDGYTLSVRHFTWFLQEVMPSIRSIWFTFFNRFSLYPANLVLQANEWRTKKRLHERMVNMGVEPGGSIVY
jgi:hypothetical protein